MQKYMQKLSLSYTHLTTYECGALKVANVYALVQHYVFILGLPQEMILSLVVQLIGVMLYGYCLGAIAATITNTASSRYIHMQR